MRRNRSKMQRFGSVLTLAAALAGCTAASAGVDASEPEGARGAFALLQIERQVQQSDGTTVTSVLPMDDGNGVIQGSEGLQGGDLLQAGALGSPIPRGADDSAFLGALEARDTTLRVAVRTASVSAAFARYQGIDQPAVWALLRGDETLPVADPTSSRGDESCVLASEQRGDDPWLRASDDMEVHLLDVGALTVSTGDQDTRLVARTFPELADVMGGAFYADDIALPKGGAEPGEEASIGVWAEGGFDLPAGFSASGMMPPSVDGLSVQGADPSGALHLDRGAPLAFRWTTSDARDRLQFALSSGAETLLCEVADDGGFVVPAELWSRMPRGSNARMTVRRVRLHEFEAEDLDAGWLVTATRQDHSLVVR